MPRRNHRKAVNAVKNRTYLLKKGGGEKGKKGKEKMIKIGRTRARNGQVQCRTSSCYYSVGKKKKKGEGGRKKGKKKGGNEGEASRQRGPLRLRPDVDALANCLLKEKKGREKGEKEGKKKGGGRADTAP